MKHRVTLFVVFLVLLSTAAAAVAGPILKPRKYHGPIPRSSLALRVGFFAGASNSQMYDYLDTRVPAPARDETLSNDFDSAPMAELAYVYKAHPQFAVRANFYVAYLKSDWTGIIDTNIPPPDDATQQWLSPTVNTNVSFDILLFTLETSALYYFTDAAVKEFQPYFGGGFSFAIPYQEFQETSTIRDRDEDPGDPGYVPEFDVGEVYSDYSKTESSFQAGVHGIVGILYYFGNRWAISLEGRGQILQSKFPLAVRNEQGEPEDVDFDVDLSGFMMTAGVSYAF